MAFRTHRTWRYFSPPGVRAFEGRTRDLSASLFAAAGASGRDVQVITTLTTAINRDNGFREGLRKCNVWRVAASPQPRPMRTELSARAEAFATRECARMLDPARELILVKNARFVDVQ